MSVHRCEKSGYRLLWKGVGKGARGTVVRVYKNHIFDAMPGDAPSGGGSWSALDTEFGVEYVANWYSLSYARRVFRSLVLEAETFGGGEFTEPLTKG